jgi:MoaA/NifB/PqqE/SkfB family radical SAM enzyme
VVSFELSNACNLRCPICPNPTMKRERKNFDYNLFRETLDDNPQLQRIVLSNWGEPLLHPQLMDFIYYAKAKGIHVSFTTNATLLTPELSREILLAKINMIRFSLDGIGADYEKIRGWDYQDVKDKMLYFIRLCDEFRSKCLIELAVTVTEENENSLDNIRTEWKGLVDQIHFQPVVRFIPYQRHYSCRELWRSLSILSNGIVIPCCSDAEGVLEVGRIPDNSLIEIWNGEPLQKLRREHLRREFSSLCLTCNEYKTDKVNSRF